MTNSILNQFIQDKSIPAGGIKLFEPKDAEQLVHLLIAASLKVHGIDGIFVSQEGYRPSMEDSISTSDMYAAGQSMQAVEAMLCKFIEERLHKKNLLFEVVF